MNPLLLEILPLVRQGYCCSQLLMLLLLQSQGRENPELVRAVRGLCGGLGDAEGPCGLLTGGACVLSCAAESGPDGESHHPALTALVSDYRRWFAERTEKYGGAACFQVIRGLSEEEGRPPPAAGERPDAYLCGGLFAECWERLLALLEKPEISAEPL